MRNLRLNDHTWKAIETTQGGFLCVDAVTSNTFQVTTQGVKVLSDDVAFPEVIFSDHEIKTAELIGADIVTAINVICVLTKEGDVITVNTENQEVDVVGSFAAGLEAACWSPDQELLVLVTGEANAVVLTTDFDPVVEFSLNQEDFGESKFINVGWGKKETQFHGREGKAAAKSVAANVKPVLEWDDRQPRISWRGDGQLFVISYVAGRTMHRRLRIVNREGVLQYTSEDVDGLEQALSWRPSGSLIAASQRLPNKHDIVFFEKNGLRHGEFTLPFKPNDMVVKEVMWNQDSSVLLVWLKRIEAEESESVIQLWTMGNYHWYLKQEMKFGEDVCHMFWDSESPLKLHLLTTRHQHCFNWVMSTDMSHGNDVSDLAVVAVIDGNKLKMTPFRQSVIPPPMAAYEITFKESINAVMFAPSSVQKYEASPNSSVCVEDSGFLETCDPPGCNSNNLCVVHGLNILTFLTQAYANEILEEQNCGVQITGSGGNGFTVKVRVHRVFAQHVIEWESNEKPKGQVVVYNWLWVSKNMMVAFYKDGCSCNAVVIELQAIGSEGGRVVVRSVLPLEDSVLSAASAPDGSIIILQLINGSLLKFDIMSNIVEPYETNGEEISFPNICQQVSLCPVDDGSEFLVLGLTSRNRLYWEKKQLFANCTSYHIHTDHLLVTTANHNLHVVPLLRKAFEKLLEGNQEDCWALGTRKVERGSRLVTAVPQDTRVVLQMPRGNLEVISPRPLTVHMIKHLLNDHKYHQAMDMMRKHRVDLNLVHDHNPTEFFKHTLQFVQNVNNGQWLDLFLANLSEVDVTNTMYSFNYFDEQVKSVPQGNKIDQVSIAVREAMIKVDEEKYLLPILTSLVKMTKSQMDVALRKVQEMKDAKDKKFIVSAEDGLRHLMYIADANELYDVALGTYDFDLVMMVAEKSQKDPKEYLPFLNELKTLEENYMKFKINVHLRRFKKALECISHTSEYQDECIQLIVTEKLYREALQIFPASSDMNKLVCERYANYLASRQHHNEAAIMYMRAGRMEESMEAYQQAGNWKMVLVVGAQMKYDKEKMNDLCYSLVEYLKDRGSYADAAWIYEDYLKNEEDAVECLVLASQWDDALRVAYRYNRPDLVDTNIRPGAIEQYETCMAVLDKTSITISQNCSRLEIVRSEKQKQQLEFLEGTGEPQLDCDLYSDTSTVTGVSHSQASGTRTGTSVSGKTFRSSKSKRKLERKKYSTKEGSTYEDVGLVVSLHETITMVDQMAGSATALSTVLVSFGLDQKAAEVQDKFTSLLNQIDKIKNQIWPTEAVVNESDHEFGPQFTTENVVTAMKGEGEAKAVSFAIQRMKEVEPHQRFAPVVTRPKNWALHMLKKDR